MLRAIVLLLASMYVGTAAFAQRAPYQDAGSPSEAVGMMVMSVRLSQVMQRECGKRYPEKAAAMLSSLDTWHRRDAHAIQVAERHFREMVLAKPALRTQVDTMMNAAFDARVITPFLGLAPEQREKIVRNYCDDYFRDLESGVWRQRTPHTYQFLEQEP